MNKKLLSCFLMTAFISLILGGCGRDAPPDIQDIIAPEIAGTTEIIETLAPTQASVDNTTEPITEAKSDFDFEKTLEQTYICGHQLSYPLTWGQLGEDFSIDPEGASHSPKIGTLSCAVNYKGGCLGIVTFKDCESVDNITDDTEIFMILIQNMDMDKFDVPKITVNGLELHDTHEDVYEALGSSYEIGIDESKINYCDDNRRRFLFGFSVRENEDKLISVGIIFRN